MTASSGGYAGGVDAGDTIKVSFAGLQQGAVDIGNSAKAIDTHLDQLKKDLQPLVSTWTGTASENYQAFQGEWDKAAADLQQVLASIGTAVSRAGDDYADGERNNANRWT